MSSNDSEPQVSLPKPRQIQLEKIEKYLNETLVNLQMSGSNGINVDIGSLILPDDSWKFVQGEGNIAIGSDYGKSEIKIPEYCMRIDGDFGHDYEATECSRIDEGEYKYVEAHEFLKLDGAGYTLLHEVGHAWTDSQLGDKLSETYDVDDKSAEQWSEHDYQIFMNFVIPREERAWEKADELDRLLQEKGINIEPNWTEARKKRHKDYAIQSYYSKLREYKSLDK